MKLKFTFLLVLGLCLKVTAQTGTFYDYGWQTIGGDYISMNQFAGKKVMVVNVASFCTYTPEFAQLSQLDSMYSARYNFAIIGFPCDDFGHQMGTDSQVITTCTRYNVNFQIMSTVTTRGTDTTPVYTWLERRYLNGMQDRSVTWNFNKFLIDRQGHWVAWHDSPVSPLDPSITNWIIEDSASLTTGIEPAQADRNMLSMLSANPANANIALHIEAAGTQRLDINLYTIDGRLMGNIFKGDMTGSRNIDYPVSAIPSGLYFIRATSGSMDRTIKCSIQH
jgi:glutathione peroxidase